MNRYRIKIEAEFPIAAKDEDEATDIADQQVKQINRDYCFHARVSEIKRET